ncbi:Uncharacterized protein GBIM_00991, partial [Gryllus bimaculatus]
MNEKVEHESFSINYRRWGLRQEAQSVGVAGVGGRRVPEAGEGGRRATGRPEPSLRARNNDACRVAAAAAATVAAVTARPPSSTSSSSEICGMRVPDRGAAASLILARRMRGSMETNITLWQFLLELLLSNQYTSIITWTNNDGEFKLCYFNNITFVNFGQLFIMLCKVELKLQSSNGTSLVVDINKNIPFNFMFFFYYINVYNLSVFYAIKSGIFTIRLKKNVLLIFIMGLN